MKGGSPSETHQTTEVILPDWVNKASESNYNKAQKIAGKKFDQYEGPRVADQSTMTTQGYDYLMSNVGAQDPLFENAAALQGRITELDPIYAKAQGILSASAGPWDVDPYLNPYIDEVESRSIANAQRDLDYSLMEAEDAARKAGAFGGSTAAVEQGVLAAEGAREIGDLSAELRAAGYDKATADLLADRANMQKAAEGMMSGASTQGKGWLDAASGFLDTAAGRGAQVATDVASMLSAGAQEQAYRQSQIDADMAKYEEKANYDLEKLNILLSSLGMSPYGKTEETTKTSVSEDPGTDWATAALGIGKLLTPLKGGLSDRRDKKDIEELGEDKTTGLPIYAFRYKSDPASSPKVIGPMAQDVEEKYPEAVTEIGGHKIINYGILAEAA